MKKTLTLIFAFSLTLFTVNSNASHMMGGDITYSCLGGNDYLITMSFYRDCSGVTAPTSISISVQSNSCNSYLSFNLPLDTAMEVNPGCSNWLTYCNGGGLPGVEVYVFRDTIQISMSCDDWVLSFDQCCRNGVTANLVDPSTQGLYIESTLDNLNFGCNSSPVFQEQPSYIMCIDQPFCINNSAYEADGDSLVYEMVDPLDGGNGGQPIPFVPPFTAVNPMPSSSGINFDAMTGNVCLTPNVMGSYVIAFRVNEYRNGSLIGTTMRDVQVWVTNCDTSLAHTISGTVSDTTSIPVSSGTVEVFEYDLNMGSMNLYGTQPLGPGGTFSFTTVPYGQYVVRATPDTIAYPNTAATYHWNTFYWSYANVLSAFCDSNFVADVQLVGYGNLAGSGYMSGYLGELGVNSTIGDPYPNINILLVRSSTGELIASTTTDLNGEWSISGIPNGYYKIVVDVPGLSMVSHHYVSISAGNEVHTNLDYVAEMVGIMVASINVGIPDAPAFGRVNIFPNPSEGAITISFYGGIDELVEVTLLDLSGRSLMSWRENAINARIMIELPNIANGTYILELRTESVTTTKQVSLLN